MWNHLTKSWVFLPPLQARPASDLGLGLIEPTHHPGGSRTYCLSRRVRCLVGATDATGATRVSRARPLQAEGQPAVVRRSSPRGELRPPSRARQAPRDKSWTIASSHKAGALSRMTGRAFLFHLVEKCVPIAIERDPNHPLQMAGSGTLSP